MEIWRNVQRLAPQALRRRPAHRPTRSPRSASPTSARPRCCGTARTGRPGRPGRRLAGHPHRRAGRGAGRRRPAPDRFARPAAGCRWPPTSPARGCAGCSTRRPGLRERAERGEVLFGTMETWLIWNLTGGPDGGVHVTDVTNASRTMLMDIEHAAVGRRAARRASASRARCCRRSGPRPRSTARPTVVLPGVQHRRRARRPAGGAVRADLLRPRRGQVHVRHRQLPAAQHRRGDRPVVRTGCSPPSATRSATSDAGLRAGGLDRDHRLAGAVVPRQPRADHQRAGDRDAGAAPSTTTAAATSCRRSPGCSRRTGAARRAA